MDDFDNELMELAQQLQDDIAMMRRVSDARAAYQEAIRKARAAYVSTVMDSLGMTLRRPPTHHDWPDMTAPLQ